VLFEGEGFRIGVIDGQNARRVTPVRELQLPLGPPPALGFRDGGIRHVELEQDAGVGAKRRRSEPRVLTGEGAILRHVAPSAQALPFDRLEAVDSRSVIDDHCDLEESSFWPDRFERVRATASRPATQPHNDDEEEI
jgi:hypothetical protein